MESICSSWLYPSLMANQLLAHSPLLASGISITVIKFLVGFIGPAG
jgi:hypothetical protein